MMATGERIEGEDTRGWRARPAHPPSARLPSLSARVRRPRLLSARPSAGRARCWIRAPEPESTGKLDSHCMHGSEGQSPLICLGAWRPAVTCPDSGELAMVRTIHGDWGGRVASWRCSGGCVTVHVRVSRRMICRRPLVQGCVSCLDQRVSTIIKVAQY
jgi:hypothetical protein